MEKYGHICKNLWNYIWKNTWIMSHMWIYDLKSGCTGEKETTDTNQCVTMCISVPSSFCLESLHKSFLVAIFLYHPIIPWTTRLPSPASPASPLVFNRNSSPKSLGAQIHLRARRSQVKRGHAELQGASWAGRWRKFMEKVVTYIYIYDIWIIWNTIWNTIPYIYE